MGRKEEVGRSPGAGGLGGGGAGHGGTGTNGTGGGAGGAAGGNAVNCGSGIVIILCSGVYGKRRVLLEDKCRHLDSVSGKCTADLIRCTRRFHSPNRWIVGLTHGSDFLRPKFTAQHGDKCGAVVKVRRLRLRRPLQHFDFLKKLFFLEWMWRIGSFDDVSRRIGRAHFLAVDHPVNLEDAIATFIVLFDT